MMKRNIFTGLLPFSAVLLGYSQNIKNHELREAHFYELYTKMISEIEYLDAEGTTVRNTKKSVSWEDYKAYHDKQYKQVKTIGQFKDFGNGFVSGHSYFDFMYPLEEQKKESVVSTMTLGYTYPEISFFELESRKKME